MDYNKISNQIREDYNCNKGYSQETYFREYGDSYDFWINLFLKQLAVPNNRMIPQDLYDFKFELYKSLYENQSKNLSHNRYHGKVCNNLVLSADSLVDASPIIKNEIRRLDSIAIVNDRKPNLLGNKVRIYDYFQSGIPTTNQNKEIRYDLKKVPQYLVRFDGKKAIRVITSPVYGARLHVYSKIDNLWTEESKTTLNFITIF